MASRRNRRADEVTPKLHYRPGVLDPDLEATIVGFYEAGKSVEKTPIPFPAPSSAAPTVGLKPTVGAIPTVPLARPLEPEIQAGDASHPPGLIPTVGVKPTVGMELPVGSEPTVVPVPAVGLKHKIRAIGEVQDALTLAGIVLYKAMYGTPDGNNSKTCRKGYRELASDARLDKDTVRDLIADFKAKGIVEEIATYDPDTRLGKTYEVLSYRAILRRWREAGIQYVLSGRKPMFCSVTGQMLDFIPTVGSSPIPDAPGPVPTVGAQPTSPVGSQPTGTVGPGPTLLEKKVKTQEATSTSPVIVTAMHEAMGRGDDDAAERIAAACRQMAPDVTYEEIAHFIRQEGPALSRNTALDNPMGVLIRHIPRCCRGESLRLHREAVRQAAERNRGQIAVWLKDAREILARPVAGGMDRVWAEDILATYGAREGKT